jgi:hypothetical protein
MQFAATREKKDALEELLDSSLFTECCGNPRAKPIFSRIFIASL